MILAGAPQRVPIGQRRALLTLCAGIHFATANDCLATPGGYYADLSQKQMLEEELEAI
jgi:hypothetical protein